MKTEPERDATQTSGRPRHKGGGAPAWSSSGRGRSKEWVDLRSGGRGERGGGRKEEVRGVERGRDVRSGVVWCGREGGKEEAKGVRGGGNQRTLGYEFGRSLARQGGWWVGKVQQRAPVRNLSFAVRFTVMPHK